MKTDWKDAVYTEKKYTQTTNSDGTVSFADATEYTQEGDAFGAKELNEIGEEVNKIQGMTMVTLSASGWSSSAPYTQTVDVSGVTADDIPITVIDVSGASSESEEKTIKKQYGWISYFDTADGSITFTAMHQKPTVALTIGLKGVA